MHKKHLYMMDSILILATLAGVFFAVNYAQPILKSPSNGYVTTTGAVLFSFEKGDYILIDDNSAFTSPERIAAKDNLVINLKPGTYYWRVEGTLQSEIREITVQSEIDLRLRQSEDGYELVNAGNVPLNVDIYHYGTLAGNVVVEVDTSKNVSGTNFVGRENA